MGIQRLVSIFTGFDLSSKQLCKGFPDFHRDSIPNSRIPDWEPESWAVGSGNGYYCHTDTGILGLDLGFPGFQILDSVPMGSELQTSDFPILEVRSVLVEFIREGSEKNIGRKEDSPPAVLLASHADTRPAYMTILFLQAQLIG